MLKKKLRVQYPDLQEEGKDFDPQGLAWTSEITKPHFLVIYFVQQSPTYSMPHNSAKPYGQAFAYMSLAGNSYSNHRT